MARPHHHSKPHQHPSCSLSPLLPGLWLLQSQWTKSERLDTLVMGTLSGPVREVWLPTRKVTRRSPVMSPLAERAQIITCRMSHLVHKDAAPLQCPRSCPRLLSLRGTLGTTEEERRYMGSGGQGLGRLCGWKRVGRDDGVKEDGPGWETWVQEALAPCLTSQSLQRTSIHSTEHGCSQALGPSAQALAHHHRAPPRLPSTPCSGCSPSPVSPEASCAKPSAAGSLWGRKVAHVLPAWGGVPLSPMVPAQRPRREREGRDSPHCCSHPTVMPSAAACQTGTAPGMAFPGHTVAML